MVKDGADYGRDLKGPKLALAFYVVAFAAKIAVYSMTGAMVLMAERSAL